MSSAEPRKKRAPSGTPGKPRGTPRQPPGGSRKRAAGAGGAGPSAWSPRDLLVPYVLLAVSAQRAHGYFIEQYLRGLGLAQVEMTRLYRTLRQLEQQGLVTSVWEAGEGGPARRVYSLTDAGRAWLRSGATMLEGYRTAIDAFFGKYHVGASGKKER